MSILLTHAYYLENDEAEKRIMKPYPPLGLLYISAYLKEHNLHTMVYDSTFENFVKQKDFILNHRPKCIGIYCNLVTKINIVKLIKWIKSIQDFNQCKIILGGPDIRYNIENYLQTGADFLVIGEGEETMRELCQAILNNKENFEEIAGIAFGKNNQIIQTSERIKLKNLDELPLPDRSSIRMDYYTETWKKHHGTPMLSISTQRGCPYTCKWCSTAVYGQSYRRRKPLQVIEEINLLISNYGVNNFWFVDDVFTVSHKWIEEFYELAITNHSKFTFECITRAERLNLDILRKLKAIGCSKIWIGAESGSQKIIDLMDRRVDVNQVAEMIIMAQQIGIDAGTFIMLGYPEETIEDIEKTVTYLRKCSPKDFTITLAYPIKGTGLYNSVEDKIITQNNWFNTTDREIDFKRTYSRKFYTYAIKYVVNEVNAHKKGKPYLKHKTKSILAKFMMKWHK